jgi:predicted AlkP superfamily pyrophosphatase or phosphodiesterase
MIHVYGFDSFALDALCQQFTQSPEDFLADLEQQLEDGDITEEEAVQLIKDLTGRS